VGLVVGLVLVARPGGAGGGAATAERHEPDDDLDGMLEAVNARRRRRGDPELTEDGIRRAPR